MSERPAGEEREIRSLGWPEEVWVTLIPIIPMEHLFRCLVGTAIGTGVIAGLRAIRLVRPSEAI